MRMETSLTQLQASTNHTVDTNVLTIVTADMTTPSIHTRALVIPILIIMSSQTTTLKAIIMKAQSL